MDKNLKERRANKKEINYSIIPFLLAIAYLYFIQGVRPIYFLLGSGSWGVGCFVKIILHSLIVKKLPHSAEKIAGTSFINGLISGIT
ncbi:MAG: hypothetical protein K0B81_09675, partial [Candidatus Cloacimonetes bacterium]|nr:hypothetical protein [Candidatus Cloacimonadota bacterium]